MLEQLKEQVFQANIDLVNHGLVVLTRGTASVIDRESGLVVIKPDGIPHQKIKPKDMVVLNLYGQVEEGNLQPSGDAPTHLVLYRQFKNIGGVVHTYSEWATCWAQAGRGIPPLGTAHTEYFYGEIPCTRKMTRNEMESNFEHETGKVIVERFRELNPDQIPGVLVNNHGPFSWGTDVNNAVQNAIALEKVAQMAFRTLIINPDAEMGAALLNKHFFKKNKNYGQK